MNCLYRRSALISPSLCKASSSSSSSKQGFASSSRCTSQDASPSDQTASMQETLTSTTPAQIVGDGGTGRNGGRQGGRRRGTMSQPPPYADWVKGDGKQYEEPPPGRGPFWIDSVPFPLNKSFDPPPPVSHKSRQEIWHLHLTDPSNTVRTLSNKFGISIDRMHAILRLQALEAEWTRDGKVLQKSFQKNMERLLGAIDKSAADSKRVVEDEASEEVAGVIPRAPSIEELPSRADGKGDASIILPALEKELKGRAILRRKLPTGGPSAVGPTPSVQKISAGRRLESTGKMKSALTIVDLSKRPTSYIGGGVIARNQERARKRKIYKEKKEAAKAIPDK